MPFTARFLDGASFDHALGKIVCVGRNYADHVRELNNPVPDEPLLFIKPATAAVPLDQPLVVTQRGEVHFETELALLIGTNLTDVSPQQAEQAVVGIGLGLDLTLRDVQSRLKAKGQPWEIAKGFDGACPLSSFVRLEKVPNWSELSFSLTIDGELRQKGSPKEMLFPIPELLAEISRHFTLEPGDIVLTGAPAGVGRLMQGSELYFTLSEGLEVTTRVAD